MKVIFSHGKESGPWGTKIQRLARICEQRDIDVESIDYTDTPDPDARVDKLLRHLDTNLTETLLVGSSMGGYVSLVASAQVAVDGLFLMAPALYIPGYKHQSYDSKARHIEIVHGWDDDVVPASNSIQFAGEWNHSLHLIPANHPLSDALETVDNLFGLFLNQVVPGTDD